MRSWSNESLLSGDLRKKIVAADPIQEPALPVVADEGGIQHVVEGGSAGFGEYLGQVLLQRPQFRLEGAVAAVELAVAEEVGKVFAQVSISIPEEVSLAPEPRPLREDREGEHLAVRKRCWPPGFCAAVRYGFLATNRLRGTNERR